MRDANELDFMDEDRVGWDQFLVLLECEIELQCPSLL